MAGARRFGAPHAEAEAPEDRSPWTLEELAQQAGLSRTALADTDRHLEAVASEVGDQDTFSFSKVFKRTVGVSPKAFRHRNAAERSHPWRLAG